MKKIRLIVCIMLSLGLCYFAFFASSAESSLKSLTEYTVDELLLLRDMIDRELDNRGYSEEENSGSKKPVSVPQGEYTIGSDIPAGTYSLSASDGDFQLSTITIYSASGALENTHVIMADSSVGKCVLEAGQKVEISGSPILFFTYDGISFD